MTLILYTRERCDMCRNAEALMAEGGFGADVREVFIDEDLELLQRYGDQVPVVLNADTGEKLNWPFTASQVRELADAD